MGDVIAILVLVMPVLVILDTMERDLLMLMLRLLMLDILMLLVMLDTLMLLDMLDIHMLLDMLDMDTHMLLPLDAETILELLFHANFPLNLSLLKSLNFCY